MKTSKQTNQEQFIELVRGELQAKVTGSEDRNSKNKISQSRIATSVGLDQTTISQFKNGKYPGDNERVAKLIYDFFRRMDAKIESKTAFSAEDIIETKAVTKVVHACQIAHIESRLIVVTGDAGVGKTKGVAKYVAQNTGVIHVPIIPYYSAKNVINKIASNIGVDNTGSIVTVFEAVLSKLEGSSRLLLIDEAELLPYRALELIRRIYDLAGIGVVLVGMPKLIANLQGHKMEYKQLYSRVSMHVTIADLIHDDPKHVEFPSEANGPRDIEKLVRNRLPDSNGLWKSFAKYTLNPRTLDNLIAQSMKVAQHNNVPLDAKVIEKASELIIL
jgi:DNA transposition AAA+ family ATPase